MFQALYDLLGLSSDELRLLKALRRHGGGAHGAVLQRALASLATPGEDGAPALATSSGVDGRASSWNDDYDPSTLVEISLVGLLLAALPLLVVGAISVRLRLGLHRKLAVGAARCVLQLSLLGYILVPIFVANHWWLSTLYALFMCLVAAAEAISRPMYSYPGMMPQVLGALGIACAVMISFGLAVVIGVSPWYDAQYLIPMLGMLLGNACSSVAVGLAAVLDELAGGRDKVESLLALGASRVEATRAVVQRAARLALTPLLNSLNVVGIVSIPGMMTGQILGGSNPAVAARYQIVIFFLVGTATGLSAFATIYAAVLSICDAKHRLRVDLLKARAHAAAGVGAWLGEQAAEVWAAARGAATSAARRVRRALAGGPSRSRHQYFSFRSASASRAAGQPSPGGLSLLGSAPGQLRGVLVEAGSEADDGGVRRPLLHASGEGE